MPDAEMEVVVNVLLNGLRLLYDMQAYILEGQ